MSSALAYITVNTYLTVIVRKRVQYRRIAPDQAILHKLEHYNCFKSQHIDNKSQFYEKMIKIYDLLSQKVYYNIVPRAISYTTSSKMDNFAKLKLI